MVVLPTDSAEDPKKERPEVVTSIEERARQIAAKKAARRAAKRERLDENQGKG